MIAFNEDKLKYFEVTAISNGKQWDPYETLNPIYEEWDYFVESYVLNAPDSLKSAKFTGGQYLVWMVTEKAFVDSAQQGVLIAIIFAFMILTIVTCNMLMAFLAIISVGMVMVSVIAVMVYQGWEMGVSESVSVVMLIGLSVDYIVHLAQAYKRSVASHRSAKTKFAF